MANTHATWNPAKHMKSADAVGKFEYNPFGQYGWLEDALNLPITSALADLLESGARA